MPHGVRERTAREEKRATLQILQSSGQFHSQNTSDPLKRAMASSVHTDAWVSGTRPQSFNPSSGRWPLQSGCARSVAWEAGKGKHFREAYFWEAFLPCIWTIELVSCPSSRLGVPARGDAQRIHHWYLSQ